jgi:HD-GYP domain-containing protein (c-di-GMP phosphodiesterase class II)
MELTNIYRFSERESKLMEIAGLLHDVGKLAVDDMILEKNGALNHQEFNAMRKHSYYTYTILKKVKGLEQIVLWAAHHHERLDGKGYPFHVKGSDFSKLSRIMCVADIVTAITEDRPYRAGMSSEKAIGILADMADNGGIDQEIVEVVTDNFAQINDARMEAQQAALQDYKVFYSSAED